MVVLPTRARQIALVIILLVLTSVLACTSGVSSGVKFGLVRSGARVTQTGNRFPVSSSVVYVEVDFSHKFGATTLTIQVLRHSANVDQIVDSADLQVASDWNVYSQPLIPAAYGTGDYRVVASINGSTIATGTVTFY